MESKKRLIIRRRAAPGFVLLEVIVSLVILGIAVASLMRSFTISMTAIRKNDITTEACVLAESLFQAFDVDPPKSQITRGTFEEDGFPQYSWELKYKKEEIHYRHIKGAGSHEDLKPLRHATLTVTYDDKRIHKFSPVEVDLYFPPIERFSYSSKFLNELFKEDDND